MKTENHRVLIIDDERPVLMTLEALLKRHGYEVDTAGTASQGVKLLKSDSPSLVLLDLQLPDANGLEMLDRIKTELPDVQVIILTAHDSLHNAIESIKRGAFHFISKPYAPEELLSLVENALEKQFLLREAEKLREKTVQLEKRLEIAEARPTPIFQSKPMQEIQELIDHRLRPSGLKASAHRISNHRHPPLPCDRPQKGDACSVIGVRSAPESATSERRQHGFENENRVVQHGVVPHQDSRLRHGVRILRLCLRLWVRLCHRGVQLRRMVCRPLCLLWAKSGPS